MLKRKAEKAFADWRASSANQALMVTGARQVGKTYLIEHFARESYRSVVKFDLVDQPEVLEAFNAARSSAELFVIMSAYAGQQLIPGETVIFIDEVQECSEALTFVKYLVQREEYDYIVSGSLLGVELEDIRSVPVGYLRVVDMYPLDFEEFCWAQGVGKDAWSEAKSAFENRRPVLQPVHERLMQLYHWYLLVGGMPQAVDAFTATQNLSQVGELHRDIMRLYRHDISKYAAKSRRLVIKDIYDQIPSQLDSQSKRFNFSSIAPKGTYERYRADFLWLVAAGVAIVVNNVTEPKRPLLVNKESAFFKFFLNDVGLLMSACGIEAVRESLANDVSVSYGAIYENAVAQELHAHGKGGYFFRSKKMGEVDFLVQSVDGILPVEVKSGKTYKRHSALSQLLETSNYAIERAVVLCESNVEVVGPISYLPVYMAAFL